MATKVLGESELVRFRKAQRLAYECAETISAQMQPGMSERQVATRMGEFLRDHGAELPLPDDELLPQAASRATAAETANARAS
ncbi:MAG: hypothetical protein QM661_05095 [Solimonas sp.]